MITPQLAEVLNAFIEDHLNEVHTAIPGKVQAFYPATAATPATVDVVPQIQRPLVDSDGEITHEELPVLPNLPIAYPRSGKWFMHWPLAAGDFVWVMFSEYCMDQWRSKGDLSVPGLVDHLTMCSGVAYPGVSPNTSPLSLLAAHPTDMVIGYDDATTPARIHIKSGGTVEVVSGALSDSADDFVALAGKVRTLIKAAADAAAAAAFAQDGGKGAFQEFSSVINSSDFAAGNLKADEPTP